jgi:hypothetical protein
VKDENLAMVDTVMNYVEQSIDDSEKSLKAAEKLAQDGLRRAAALRQTGILEGGEQDTDTA